MKRKINQYRAQRPKFPKFDFKADQTIAKSVFHKLVKNTEKTNGNNKSNHNKSKIPSGHTLEGMSDLIASDVMDYQAIFEMHPDNELAMSILVSSILAPKDLISTELEFSLMNNIQVDDTTGNFISKIKSYFTEQYNLPKLLTNMLEDMLFKRGSYPMVILPESSVDEVINSNCRISLESMTDQFTLDGDPIEMGFLGDVKRKTNVSLESLVSPKRTGTVGKINDYVDVTDNFNVLKWPMVADKARQDHIHDILGFTGVSLESREVRSKKTLYSRREYTQMPLEVVNVDKENKSHGHPMVMKLASESIIPVHVPGDPSQHVGYFILLDKNGNPIDKPKEAGYYKELNQRINDLDETKDLLQQTNLASGHHKVKHTDSDISKKELLNSYTEIIESDLIHRLENGIYDDNVEVAKPTEVYRIMLARALAKKHTRILFVPAELVCYFAFDYNENGIGRSLLEQSKVITSIRSVLMLANAMGELKSSIGRTKVNIGLDAEDTDPEQTVEFMLNEFSKHQRSAFPLGLSSPSDITDAIQKASVDVAVSGNARYPETTLDISDNNRGNTSVSTDLEDKMRRRQYMSYGLSPEMIDTDMNIDYAALVVSSNLLMAKRVTNYQDRFTPQLKNFIKLYTLNSSYLREELKETLSKVKREKDEDMDGLLHRMLNNLIIGLPKPDTTRTEGLRDSYQTYTDTLDMAIEAYIQPEMLDGLIDSEVEGGFDAIIACIRGYYQRQWLAKNNLLPELNSLVDPDDGVDLKGVHAAHLEPMIKNLAEFLRSYRKMGRKIDKKLEDDEYKEEEEEEDEPAESDGDNLGDDGTGTDDDIGTVSDIDTNDDSDGQEAGTGDPASDDANNEEDDLGLPTV
ncbi:hypothetical protein [Endozoicomonas sp. ONNA1]|uniref:hypothetical protein n=1 Tax=Endozoicomonas sp. ONNA1 TaxID=2828740 RepID=UPI0021475462|nr:hypothetical protein [Endozoicomonas sp. ONNA1]